MSTEYSDALYIERDVDRVLWDKTRTWLGSSPIRWISVESAPGRGNSWLLEHLKRQALRYKSAFADIAIIVATGSSIDPSSALGPIGSELYHRYHQSRTKLWKRVKRRAREMGAARVVGFSLIGLGVLALASVLKGLSEYSHVITLRKVGFGVWLGGFFRDFLPQYWSEFPIWFLTEWSVTVPTAIALAAYSAYRVRKGMGRPAEEEELQHFQTRDELAIELAEICARCRGLVLLIDDAHLLPDREKQLLIDLVNPEPGSKLQKFSKRYRILIVTIESRYSSWDGRPAEIEQPVEVPAFSLVELHEIATRQLSEPADQEARNNLNAIVENAGDNVRALFAHREKQLVAELTQEFSAAENKSYQGRFGVAELMAYLSALRRRILPTGELLTLLESPAARLHFEAFGYRPVSDPVGLLNEFKETSSLIEQVHKKVLYLDTLRCRLLRQALAGSPDRKQILGEAHMFWFGCFSSKSARRGTGPLAEEIRALSFDQRRELKGAAWHAAQIGTVLDRVSDVLISASGLTEDQRRSIACEVAAVMVRTAVVYRHEGDFIESDDLLEDALEWLRDSNEPEQKRWLEQVIDERWKLYWLSGSIRTRERLNRMAVESADLTGTTSWRVNQRFEQFLQGAENLQAPPHEAALRDANLCNMHRLTETLATLRRTHGLLKPALADATIDIAGPVITNESTIIEAQLFELQAAAENHRNRIDELVEVLGAWRRSVEKADGHDGYLGRQMTSTFNSARYWHSLADVMELGLERIEDLPDGREEARANLESLVRTACLDSPADDVQLQEYVSVKAQLGYEKTLKLAALLGCRAVVMEVSFHLGVLLKQYTPRHQQIDFPPWWQRWDELFKQSIELERDSQWILHTPEMHLVRWRFFEEKDHEHSVEDAFNAYQSAKRAHYPIKLVLDWHQQVSSRLTNFSDSDLDRQRDAELHEVWAHELAQLPEAAGRWDYEQLEHEQADSLHFAAQARRMLKDFEGAERLLNEAEKLLETAKEDKPEGSETQDVRDLNQGLRLQRAWLFHSQHREKEYPESIRDLWRSVRIEDEACAIVLSSLLGVEWREKRLDEPWPATPNALPYVDPDNDNMSLPPEWFTDSPSIQLKKRFEFRFFQLLNLVSFVKRFGSKSIPVDLLGLLTDRPSHIFSVPVLQTVAINRWFGVNNFGNVALTFAKLGREIIPSQSDTKAFLVNLLEVVQFYFAEVVQVDRDELEALKLLMGYEPDSESYRLQYVRVLTESKYLLRHELLAREAAETPNWFAIANTVNDYLSVLVDTSLLSNWISMGLQQTRMSREDFLQLQGSRREALQQAKARYDAGELVGCRQLLQDVLPPEQSPWVFLEDLQALDLWLRCASAKGGGSPNADNARRAAALRKSTEQFIRQFGLVIGDPVAQRLATEILDAIRQ